MGTWRRSVIRGVCLAILGLTSQIRASGIDWSAKANLYNEGEQPFKFKGYRGDLGWSGPMCEESQYYITEPIESHDGKVGVWDEDGKKVAGAKGHAILGMNLLGIEGKSKDVKATVAGHEVTGNLNWEAGAKASAGIDAGVTVSQDGFKAGVETGASIEAKIGGRVNLSTSIDGVAVTGSLNFGFSLGYGATAQAVVEANWAPGTDQKTRIKLGASLAFEAGAYLELELEVDTASLVESLRNGGLKPWAEWLRSLPIPEGVVGQVLSALKQVLAQVEAEEARQALAQASEDTPSDESGQGSGQESSGTTSSSEGSGNPSSSASEEDRVPESAPSSSSQPGQGESSQGRSSSSGSSGSWEEDGEEGTEQASPEEDAVPDEDPAPQEDAAMEEDPASEDDASAEEDAPAEEDAVTEDDAASEEDAKPDGSETSADPQADASPSEDSTPEGDAEADEVAEPDEDAQPEDSVQPDDDAETSDDANAEEDATPEDPSDPEEDAQPEDAEPTQDAEPMPDANP